jgi:hypothetical protein
MIPHVCLRRALSSTETSLVDKTGKLTACIDVERLSDCPPNICRGEPDIVELTIAQRRNDRDCSRV